MTGRTLGHYEFLELLGAGGMGNVYKARDTRLNRYVAVKVLRGDFDTTRNRKQRFIQEAQAASALNHPNIVTIHDVLQIEDAECLVMEYVAGQTLDAMIPSRGMRLNEALRIAVPVAEGLRRAHAAGIIHRDIKPSNIIVSGEGPVKILDFGLAKLTEASATSEDDATRTVRPETEEGTVMGTVAYMSPEQAEGRKVDVRTDIFSFGVLLYEMLSGRRAFAGNSKLSTMSAILKEEPAPLDNVPPELEKIIRRCLRKDREKRYQHMDDLKLALEEVREESESGRLAAAGPVVSAAAPARRRVWMVSIGGTAALLLLLGGMFFWRRGETAIPSPGTVLRQVTFDPGLTTEPSVWAAGDMVAFASDRAGGNLDIWIQHLQTGEARKVTSHPADDREPSYSPDGSKIAFRSERDGGGIYVVSTLSGEERRITDGGHGPRFSPDGKWIAFYEGQASYDRPVMYGELYVVPAGGGPRLRLAPELQWISPGVWSPTGDRVLFTGAPKDGKLDWWVAPADGAAPAATGAVEAMRAQKLRIRPPNAWIGDTVYFPADLGDSRNLWKSRIDPQTFQVRGPAERLTSGHGLEEYANIAGERLVFGSLTENADIWSLPLEPNSGKITGEIRRITEELAPNDSASVDRDGKHVVYRTTRGEETRTVWKDIESGQERSLRASLNVTGAPRISPDGSRVAEWEVRSGAGVTTVAAATGGAPRPVAEGINPRNWAADGKRLLVTSVTENAMGFFDPDTGKAAWFLQTPPGGFNAPAAAPDDRWVVFYLSNAGRSRIWAAPTGLSKASNEAWVPITDGAAWDVVPEFSPDGKTIYFLSHRDGFRCHWAVHVDAATRKPIGAPFAVQHYHNPRRSPGYTRVGRVTSAVARDKIVFTMSERTGNIWLAEMAR